MNSLIDLSTLRPSIVGCRIVCVVLLRHFIGIFLDTFFYVVRLQAPSAAKHNIRHVPATLENVSNIQDVEESATDTAASRHGSPQLKVGFCGESPDEYDRYQEHFAASHKSRGTNRKVQH